MHERIAPPGSRSTAHSHSHLVESFYVLEGEFVFEIGNEPRDGSPGSFVSAPRGVEHAWRVVGDAPGRALILFAPSAKRAYFEELDALVRSAPGGRPDGAQLRDLARRYDWL
jgi:quercetin dioxygenase-like cupin family protein